MSRLFTTRRSEWLPGMALLGAAFGMAAVAGISLGVRSWALYVGLIVAALLGFGWLERRQEARRSRRPERPRGKLKMIPGGRYDLAKDDSTDRQKYVM